MRRAQPSRNQTSGARRMTAHQCTKTRVATGCRSASAATKAGDTAHGQWKKCAHCVGRPPTTRAHLRRSASASAHAATVAGGAAAAKCRADARRSSAASVSASKRGAGSGGDGVSPRMMPRRRRRRRSWVRTPPVPRSTRWKTSR